ncbi:MAG: HNH endonuclease [Gracilibacteraceae bacterium]|nr:HNH endonuclease [Gracilibacteraceae bacterium]
MDFARNKEVTEITTKRFAESPLGRAAENKIFDKPMSEYDKPLETGDGKMKNCPREGYNGHWDSARGDSKWHPDRDYIPGKVNPDSKTWGETLDKYGIDGINYTDGEPDFRDVSKGTVEIEEFSSARTDNFDKADIELASQKECSPEEVAKWRKENRYTWHECKDMKTMQKTASEVHSNIPHSGGISEAKKEDGGI